jgi:DNA-binding response OmpR family regulator
MTKPVKILIVEDEMIIGANISLQLTSFGYEVSGIVPRGEEALVHIRQNKCIHGYPVKLGFGSE